jgi:hypothetical protein
MTTNGPALFVVKGAGPFVVSAWLSVGAEAFVPGQR